MQEDAAHACILPFLLGAALLILPEPECDWGMLRPSECMASGLLLLPLSLQEETSLFTVDDWGVMNNCREKWGGHYVRQAEERRLRGGATGRCFMLNQRGPFFCLQCPRLSSLPSPSSLSLSTPEIKMLEGPASHRGVIRVCCSLSVLPSSSSLPHRRGEECTGSIQWGGALLETIMTRQAVLSHRGGSSLNMQPG